MPKYRRTCRWCPSRHSTDMYLRRYRRKTLEDALRAVREDLGPDALVLSTRVVRARGLRGWIGGHAVDIMAAAERPAMSGFRRASGRPTIDYRSIEAVAARLEATGIAPALAREVAAAHPAAERRDATVRSLRRTLAKQLASLAAADKEFAPVEAFVGPPGVGKTTTIAKIAAQERARQGARFGLVAADAFRVGAVEQLRIYADILATPLAIARTPADLEAALERGCRPLLVDTAGRSASDRDARDMLRVLARADVRTHLVLAADTPPLTARRAFERFDDARPSRIVLTKLDETESLGPLVSVLCESGLPVSYLGFGQQVPDDLQRATPAAIAAWAMGERAEGAWS